MQKVLSFWLKVPVFQPKFSWTGFPLLAGFKGGKTYFESVKKSTEKVKKKQWINTFFITFLQCYLNCKKICYSRNENFQSCSLISMSYFRKYITASPLFATNILFLYFLFTIVCITYTYIYLSSIWVIFSKPKTWWIIALERNEVGMRRVGGCGNCVKGLNSRLSEWNAFR